MRGHVEVVAEDGPPARWADGAVEIADGTVSLRAVNHLAQMIRAARVTREIHERCAEDGYRRLVRTVLDAGAGMPEEHMTMPARIGRGTA
jgi:hypothetical protein